MMPSTKKQNRLEAKKRKIAAFLEIAKLNDADKKKRKTENLELETETKSEKGLGYDEMRAKVRQRNKVKAKGPVFDLKNYYGRGAAIGNKNRKPLFLSDLRDLIRFSVVGAPYGSTLR